MLWVFLCGMVRRGGADRLRCLSPSEPPGAVSRAADRMTATRVNRREVKVTAWGLCLCAQLSHTTTACGCFYRATRWRQGAPAYWVLSSARALLLSSTGSVLCCPGGPPEACLPWPQPPCCHPCDFSSGLHATGPSPPSSLEAHSTSLSFHRLDQTLINI